MAIRCKRVGMGCRTIHASQMKWKIYFRNTKVNLARCKAYSSSLPTRHSSVSSCAFPSPQQRHIILQQLSSNPQNFTPARLVPTSLPTKPIPLPNRRIPHIPIPTHSINTLINHTLPCPLITPPMQIKALIRTPRTPRLHHTRMRSRTHVRAAGRRQRDDKGWKEQRERV